MNDLWKPDDYNNKERPRLDGRQETYFIEFNGDRTGPFFSLMDAIAASRKMRGAKKIQRTVEEAVLLRSYEPAV